MSQLIVSLAWCWMQTMVVTAVAIIFSALAMRRSPAASAAIAWAGVLAAFAVVLLAAAPPPHWTLRFPLRRFAAVATQSETPTAAPMAAMQSTGDSAAPSIAGLNFLHDIIAAARSSHAAAASHREASRLALGAWLIAISFGLARIAHGLMAIAKLRRTSRAVADLRAMAVVSELAGALGLRSPPEVRESTDLASAAVVGWWKADVLLPRDWREWSAAELRAVIAHELAHMARRDLLSRHAAALAVSIHFAQPLVYWLRRQLILAQEMAADELAASAVGDRAGYLRALSRLALRQDARPTDGPMHMLLPVFSGFLLRRIEMLRAKDGSAGRGLRLIMQWSAIAGLVVAAASTAALRGLAEPPDSKDDQADRVARANDPKLKFPAVAVFQRPAFDLGTTSFGDGGALVIRLGEILQRSDVAARAFDEWFNSAWKQAFPTAEPPAWSFGEVEYAAGTPMLVFKRLDEPVKDGTPNQFMFGANWVMFRWRKPVDELFEAFAKAPGVEKKSHQGKEYFCLPVIPTFGPVRTCVCKLDDHTLLTGVDGVGICKQLDKLAAEKSNPGWSAAWKEIDGGLVALVTTAKQVNRPFQHEVEAEKALTNLFNRQLAIGVDWPRAADSSPIVKVHIRCESADDAGQLRTELQKLAELADRLVEKQAADPNEDEAEIQIARSLLSSLRQVGTEARETEAGWQVRVEFACPWEVLNMFAKIE